MQADSNTSPLMETLLHNERISCFIVGGEKRLCLHDILNTILKDFSVQQINNACQKLQIACLESTPKQLEILKKSHLLPSGAPNCGLLTQTNAERLCAYLLDYCLSVQGPPPPPTPPSSVSSISPSTSPSALSNSSTSSSSPASKRHALKVVHECFGKTYGHVHVHMYAKSDSACVECDTCRKLYTPKNFVCHTHKYESHTRHWGFDSANWRVYLKLVDGSKSASSAGSLSAKAGVDLNNNSSGEGKSNVLNDIKVSNKDNIAANSKSCPLQEEFELFKQKFAGSTNSSSSSSPSEANGHSSSQGAFKRKSVRVFFFIGFYRKKVEELLI